MQREDVEEVHDDVAHETAKILIDDVRSTPPKFRPSTDTDAPPVLGLFGVTISDAKGASKLKYKLRVPTMLAIVTDK